MKIVRLQGGLGNQMFQYAFARGLAKKTGDEVRFDFSGLAPVPGVTPRKFALDAFTVDVPAASASDTRHFTEEKRMPWLTAIKKKFGFVVPAYVWMKDQSFHPEVWDIKGDAYFDGHWWSENYFSFIAGEIRDAFTLRHPLRPEALALMEKMRGSSISLHVRRGDYVTNNKVGVFGPEYYHQALSRALEGLKDPQVFVFSDDSAWVKENIVIPCPATFVSEYALQDWEELILMSHSSRHIISNSSFSWWGAWLDPHQDDMVIAPVHFFKSPRLENKDIAPPSWIRL